MKTTLFLMITLLSAFTINAQLTEDFNGASFPPTGWTTFVGTNGLGDDGYHNWTRYGNDVAMCRPNDAIPTGQTSEDWLVSPQFTVDVTKPMLSFAISDFSESVTNSVYTIRISTNSQTTHADFTIEQTYLESDLVAFDFTPHFVDLSSYIGQNIYVAFVLEQNAGDYMLIDNVDMATNSSASINDDFFNTSIKIYPTIVNDFFTVKNNDNITLTNVSIIDITGRIILNKNLNSIDAKINTTTLTSGQYFVKISADNTATVKIIIKK